MDEEPPEEISQKLDNFFGSSDPATMPGVGPGPESEEQELSEDPVAAAGDEDLVAGPVAGPAVEVGDDLAVSPALSEVPEDAASQEERPPLDEEPPEEISQKLDNFFGSSDPATMPGVGPGPESEEQELSEDPFSGKGTRTWSAGPVAGPAAEVRG